MGGANPTEQLDLRGRELLSLPHRAPNGIFLAASRFPHHTIQRALLAFIITVELRGELESHALVNLDVRHVSTRFEVAGHALGIRLVGHCFHESLADTLALALWEHDHYVEEVVPPGVRPDGRMGFGLGIFPYVVAL